VVVGIDAARTISKAWQDCGNSVGDGSVRRMAEETTSEQQSLKERWFRQLRRSMGIADIVTDSNARLALREEIGRKLYGGEGQLDRTYQEAAGKLIERLVDLGAEGRLDDVVVPPGWMQKGIRADQGVNESVGERVTTGVTGLEGAGDRAVATFDDIAARLAKFTREHPFQYGP